MTSTLVSGVRVSKFESLKDEFAQQAQRLKDEFAQQAQRLKEY
jgi:hypothetical protein